MSAPTATASMLGTSPRSTTASTSMPSTSPRSTSVLTASPRSKPSSFFQKKIGTPGSRRFQRFVNTAYILEQQQKLSERLSEHDLEEELDMPTSLFHRLFENADDLDTWNKFLDETEEEQDMFLLEVEQQQQQQQRQRKLRGRNSSRRKQHNKRKNQSIQSNQQSNTTATTTTATPSSNKKTADNYNKLHDNNINNNTADYEDSDSENDIVEVELSDDEIFDTDTIDDDLEDEQAEAEWFASGGSSAPSNDSNQSTNVRTSSSRWCYRQMESNVQQMFKRIYHWDFVQQLDQELMQFVRRAYQKDDKLTYDLSEPFHRMILHSLCQYYNLASQSFDSNQRRRMVAVRKRNPSSIEYVAPPARTLTRYLSSRE